jgi:GTP diphosphokinase / guanosine-3',5'-bis(diphosphate) 3'-diphosphatase
MVHVENCPRLEKYHHQPDKFVSLRWEDAIQGDFPIDCRVEIVNQRGSLASLAQTIADEGSNIENIHAEEYDGRYFGVNLTITVRNRKHLAKVFRRIRKNKNVIRVVRYRTSSKKKAKTSSMP